MTTLRYDPSASSRDLRLDLLRGVCLVKMVFAHLWITPFHVVNEWTGFVTGAEGFFFISGVVVGIVYGKRIARHGMAPARRALVERSLHLYLANLALVFLFLTLELTDTVHQRLFRAHWPGGLDWPQVFTFDQPYYLHVLPRYVVFVALAPLALWLLGRGWTGLLLGLGLGLHGWRWWGGPGVHLPFWEGEGALFPVLSWQLLFLVGMVLGFHRQRLGGWYRRWLAGGWGGIILGLGFLAFVALRLALIHGVLPPYPEFLRLIDRQTLGYLRWINLTLAFAFLFWVTDRCWRPLARWTGGLLLPVGQNALYVFLLHIPIVFGAKLALGPTLHRLLPAASQGWWLFVVDCAVMALLWALVRRRFLFQLIPR